MRANLGKVAARPTPHGLRVMTYNVLSRHIASRDNYATNTQVLAWSERFAAISEEIIAYDPDILFLQEVDEAQLDEWSELLESPPLGMTYHFTAAPDRFHGSVVAVKDSRFEIHSDEPVTVESDEDLPSQVFRSGQPGLQLLVEMKESQAHLVVGTTQLYAHPNGEYERVRQLLNFMACAVRNRNVVGIILGGSFNTTPDSPAYELLETGQIKEHGMAELVARSRNPARNGPGPIEWDTIQQLESEIYMNNLPALKSCYAALDDEPAFTKWTDDFRSTVDYIFVSKELKPTSVMALPTSTAMGPEPSSLPRSRGSKGHPSDHLPLVANVQLLSTKVVPERENDDFESYV